MRFCSLLLPLVALLRAGVRHAQTATVPVAAAKREIAPNVRAKAEERKKLEACRKDAEEQNILPRDRTKCLLACLVEFGSPKRSCALI